MLSIPFLLHAGILGVNDHLVVTITPLTRKQMGWDEVEIMEVAQRAGIVLRGKSSLGTPKMMMIAGPMFWFANEKVIRKIFARQIKTRNIPTRDIPLWKLPNFSAGTTGVSHNAAAPETYVAMPPGYIPKTIVIEPTPLYAAAETINFQATPRPQAAPRPAEQRSQREMELEQKLNKPQIGGNILLGTAGGFGAMLFGVLIWALIAFITRFEFSLAAVGMGFLIGFIAKTLTGRKNALMGMISGGLSVTGCILGSILGIVMIVCKGDILLVGAAFIALLTKPGLLLEAYGAVFSPIDLLFYGIAVFNAYKMAG